MAISRQRFGPNREVVFLGRADRELEGNQGCPPARALLKWKRDMLAEKALVALTALKRLESERGLPVHEGTRDQVRRALENAGILFVESDRGRGVMLLNEPPEPPASPRRSQLKR